MKTTRYFGFGMITVLLLAGMAFAAHPVSKTFYMGVGENITLGHWTVQLQSIGQANETGAYPAEFWIYYKHVLKNTTSIYPGTNSIFDVNGNIINVNLNLTVSNSFPYQKYAKIQLYAFHAPNTIEHNTTSISTSITTSSTTSSTSSSTLSTTTSTTSPETTIPQNGLNVS